MDSKVREVVNEANSEMVEIQKLSGVVVDSPNDLVKMRKYLTGERK